MANMTGMMFPGTIVPIQLAVLRLCRIDYGCLASQKECNQARVIPLYRATLIALTVMLAGTSAGAQDPQALLNALIQRKLQKDELRNKNEMMRLNMERLEQEEKLRFSDAQIAQELARYWTRAVFASMAVRHSGSSSAFFSSACSISSLSLAISQKIWVLALSPLINFDDLLCIRLSRLLSLRENRNGGDNQNGNNQL
jgi:hypothetical protein